MRPLFSIVMPTRNRARTLEHALKTAVNQDFDHYEVVVVDNQSTDNTAALVKGHDSPRVRYVSPPETLCMTRNWDFALAQARGDYTIVLSDDDGLLPNCLSTLARVIRESKAKVVQWHRAQYNWPAYKIGDLPNSVLYTQPRYQAGMVPAKKILNDAIFHIGCNDTPGLVNAAVHADVFAAIRAKTGGRAIVAHAPDNSSGLMIPCVTDEIFVYDKVISIAGLSEFSTGVSLHLNTGREAIGREFMEMTKREGYTTKYVETHGFSTASCVLDGLHDVGRYFPEHIHLDRVDFIKGTAQSVFELSMFSSPEVSQALTRSLITMVRETYGAAAERRFRRLLIKNRLVSIVTTDAMKPVGELLRIVLRKPYRGRDIFNGDDHGFDNIAGACDFLHRHLSGGAAARAA